MTNSAKNQVTILGSGTSTGVPMPACQCPVCLSTNPFNKRMRTSIYLHTSLGQKILVDTSPDLRTQLLNNSINSLDSVIITHDHADHVHGIDDLRPLSYFRESPIPIYTNKQTSDSLCVRFPYIFKAHEIFSDARPIIGGGVPKVDLKVFDPKTGPTLIGSEKFHFFELPHGHIQSLCFTHQKLGHIVDCNSIPTHVLEHFRNERLELLIIDCLQKEKKNKLTHLTLEETLHYIEVINPVQAGLIHLSHYFEHESLQRELYQRSLFHIFPLYDGQVFSYDSTS